jgi:arabinofuranosyltransferase
MQILPLLLLVALALAARIVPGPRTIDDAFITFRYARNLAAGSGPVFNPGQRVLGTTTPLYMGLLAAASLPFGPDRAPYPEIALVLNALADAATCILLVIIGLALGFPAAGWAAAAVWAIAPFSVTFAIGGLETSLYILILAGVYLLRLRERLFWMGILAGLAFLTRPDALIFLSLIWLDLAFRGWRQGGIRNALRKVFFPLAPFLLLVVPWAIFAAWFYGSPLPYSMFAKALAYHIESNAGLIRLLQHFGTPFLEHMTFGTGVLLATLPLYLFLSILSLWAVRKLPGGWIGMIFPWFYLAVFALANPLIFRWYLSPPLPFYMLSLFVGLSILFRLGTGVQPVPRLGLVLFALVAVSTIGFSIRGWQLQPDHGPDAPAPEMAWIKLELLYHRVAGDLETQLRPGMVIAAGDVGVLGYFTRAQILDTVGLNSPIASTFYPLPESIYVANYAIPPELILAEQPDLVVFLEVYGRNGLLRDGRFLAGYRKCLEYPTDIYGSRSLLVFCRRERV